MKKTVLAFGLTLFMTFGLYAQQVGEMTMDMKEGEISTKKEDILLMPAGISPRRFFGETLIYIQVTL